jgi:hypothetical protein
MVAADPTSRRVLLTRDLSDDCERAFRLAVIEMLFAAGPSRDFAEAMKARAVFHLGRDTGLCRPPAACDSASLLREAIDRYVRSRLHRRLMALSRECLHLSADPSVHLVVSSRDLRQFGVRFGSGGLLLPRRSPKVNGEANLCAVVVYNVVTGTCQTKYAQAHLRLQLAS